MFFARHVSALVAAALSACAPTAALMTPPPSMKPPAGQADDSTGEVAFSAGGIGSAVTYGPWRLKGEGIDLAYTGENGWAGTWNGSSARFTASTGLLQGPGTLLTIEQRDGGLRIHGTWAGRTVDIAVGRLELSGSAEQGRCTYGLAQAGSVGLSGPIGCSARDGSPATSSQGTLRLLGEAVLVPNVLLPQFVLALLSVLP